MAKAELEWRQNARIATPSNAKPVSSSGSTLRTPVDQVTSVATRVGEGVIPSVDFTLPLELVLTSALEQEATDYAIAAMCGEVTWGTCAGRSHGP